MESARTFISLRIVRVSGVVENHIRTFWAMVYAWLDTFPIRTYIARRTRSFQCKRVFFPPLRLIVFLQTNRLSASAFVLTALLLVASIIPVVPLRPRSLFVSARFSMGNVAIFAAERTRPQFLLSEKYFSSNNFQSQSNSAICS